MNFTIEQISFLERSGAQNLAQCQKSLHVHPANTFKGAFNLNFIESNKLQLFKRFTIVHMYSRNNPLSTTDCVYVCACIKMTGL